VKTRTARLGLLLIEIVVLCAVVVFLPNGSPLSGATLGPFGAAATWVITALPASIVILQAAGLWLVKGQQLTETFDTEGTWRFANVAKRAREEMSGHFDLVAIAIRYVPPAILLLAVSRCEAAALFASDRCAWLRSCTWDDAAALEVLRGARYGAAGAYTYVLLTLGQRTFRRDVTVGISIWCVVTLTTGPLLAALLARMWQLGGGSTEGWERSALFFVAGLSPRHVTSWIKETADNLWIGRADNATNPARSLPLSNIRGIDAREMERLGEEGIFNVAALALANPYRLLRNTPFDLRQIVGWMDEALLMVAVPREWESLENVGITGAIDLAWYQYLPQPEAAIVQLSQEAQVGGKSETLRRISQRLAEDAQLQLLWTLWQSGNFDRDGTGHTEDKVPSQ